MEDMREFVAYSRLLLRRLKSLKLLLDENRIEDAKKLIDEMIDDTQSDIEA